mgnify:CR=1 FL=1
MDKYIPKTGENYYYISHCVHCEPLILNRSFWDDLDESRAKKGECYKTKRQADIALEQYKKEWLKTHDNLIKKEE